MRKIYVVRLTEEEREWCREAVRKLSGGSQKARRARILLQADEDGAVLDGPANLGGLLVPSADGGERQAALRAGRLRGGAGAQAPGDAAGGEAARRRAGVAVDRAAPGRAAAGLRELVAAAVGAARGGVGDRRVVESRDRSADAKKNGVSGRKVAYWVIPPEADAEFAANMERVLDAYARPYDAAWPVLCMDEQPVQLVRETRRPIAATAKRPRRVDYEYERAGTASIFLFCEPLAGFRRATARPRRTKSDWAREVAELLEGRHAGCERVTLVSDNLNTHTRGAFYEVFEPARARALVRRIEFCHTPKHGSWLNVAESELSCMTRQCLKDRRIGDIDTLRDEIAAWSTDVNNAQRGVDWHMGIGDARRKLKSVYPQIKL